MLETVLGTLGHLSKVLFLNGGPFAFGSPALPWVILLGLFFAAWCCCAGCLLGLLAGEAWRRGLVRKVLFALLHEHNLDQFLPQHPLTLRLG